MGVSENRGALSLGGGGGPLRGFYSIWGKDYKRGTPVLGTKYPYVYVIHVWLGYSLSGNLL